MEHRGALLCVPEELSYVTAKCTIISSIHNRTREFDSMIPEESSGNRRVIVVIPVSSSQSFLQVGRAEKYISVDRKSCRIELHRSMMCATRIIETVPQNGSIVEGSIERVIVPSCAISYALPAATATPKVHSPPSSGRGIDPHADLMEHRHYATDRPRTIRSLMHA